MTTTKFDSPKVQCKLCKDIIYSRYEGEYRTCKCGAISIDSTKYYTRCIGDPANFINEEDFNK